MAAAAVLRRFPAALRCHFQTREVPSKSSVRQSRRMVAQASRKDWRFWFGRRSRLLTCAKAVMVSSL